MENHLAQRKASGRQPEDVGAIPTVILFYKIGTYLVYQEKCDLATVERLVRGQQYVSF